MIKNWENVLLSSHATVRDALEVINSDLRLKLALVVNEKKELIGIITDGDVRRALLSNYPLDGSVDNIMNQSPTVVSSKTPKSELIKLMDTKGIVSIPVVDKGRITGIETYHDALLPSEFENPVFLMAGGFGTRLRPLTDNCPKPLLEIGGRPLLETILLNFKKAGFKNFYISIHYLPEMVRSYFGDGSKWDVKIIYVHEDIPLGTGGALSLLPSDIPDLPILMMNGDILTTSSRVP